MSSDDNIEGGTNLSNFNSSNSSGNISGNDSKKVYVQLKNMTLNPIVITIGVSKNSNNVIISDTMNLVPNRELATLTETITKLYTNATKITCDFTSSSLIGLKKDSTRNMIANTDVMYNKERKDGTVYNNHSET